LHILYETKSLAIVTDEGTDVYGKTSAEIAPYGICALWKPNKGEFPM
jgi:hypothetical protein